MDPARESKTFLDLPPELRNLIHQLHFDTIKQDISLAAEELADVFANGESRSNLAEYFPASKLLKA
jgi:hypothetical protein